MAVKPRGIDVAIHATDTGCGNPCHPGHPCSSCEPFWQTMLATGRFKAYVPPTFAGSAPPNKPNFGGKKSDLY
jgi:hypothetical protein